MRAGIAKSCSISLDLGPVRLAIACPKCSSADAEARFNTDDLRCRHCNFVWSPHKNFYRVGTISYEILEEMFLQPGTLREIAVRVLRKLPADRTTFDSVYARAGSMLMEIRERHLVVSKDEEGRWCVVRGKSVREMLTEKTKRGRGFKS